MYVIDDIAYAGQPDVDLKIASVRIIDELYMLVVFSSGEKRLFDAAPLLQYPAYEILANPEVFHTAKVDHGLLVWADGALDISPEAVYTRSFPYDDHANRSA
jgi:hypothetical protein